MLVGRCCGGYCGELLNHRNFERSSYGVEEDDNCDISKVFIVNNSQCIETLPNTKSRAQDGQGNREHSGALEREFIFLSCCCHCNENTVAQKLMDL